MNIKFGIILVLLFCFYGNAFSQSVAWSYIAEQLSFGTSVTLTTDQDILLSTAGENHLVIKLDQEGNFIWQKNICFCDGYGVIRSFELEDESLLHITENGSFYTTNSEGEDSEFLLDLSVQDSIEYLGVTDVQMGSQSPLVYVYSRGQFQGVNSFQRSVVNIENYTIQQTIDTSGVSPIAFQVNSDGSRVEMLRKAEQTVIQGLTIDSDVLFEKVISEGEVYYNDVSVLSDGNMVAVGSESLGEFPFIYNGVVLYMDANGNEVWKKEFENNQEMGYGAIKIFTKVEEIGDAIQIGGNEGQMFFSDAHLLRVDKEGNVIWELTHHIIGERDGVSAITPFSEDSFLVVGTGGETDYIEPQRAYVMKVRGLLNNVNEYINEDFKLFPNPTSSKLVIESEWLWDSIEILDLNSQRVLLFQDFSEGLDVSNLVSGTYFIRLSSEQFTLTKKWIKI